MCVFRNNKFNAVTLAINNFNRNSKPVSLTIRNCRKTENNSLALWVQAMKPAGNGGKGRIVVKNCRFANPVLFTNVTAKNFSILIKDTELALPVLTNAGPASRPTIEAVSDGDHGMEIGGIVFDNVRIVSPGSKRQALSLKFYGKARCSVPFKGTLFNNGGRVDFEPLAAAGRAKLAELESLKDPPAPDLSKLVPAKGFAGFDRNQRMPLLYNGVFLLSGIRGQKVSFRTRVWKFYKADGSFAVIGPSGRQLDRQVLSYEQTGWKEYSFIPEETGIHQIKYSPNINALELRSDFPSGVLLKNGKISVVKPTGRMYFTVPAGTEDFVFTVSASPSADARIIDPAGKVRAEKKNITAAELLSVRCGKTAGDQVWAVEIRKAVWKTVLHMHAPLVPILSENPEILLKPENKYQKSREEK